LVQPANVELLKALAPGRNLFDLVIIFNLKEPQVACANYALRRLGVPVILEYEDDRFVNVVGKDRERLAL